MLEEFEDGHNLVQEEVASLAVDTRVSWGFGGGQGGEERHLHGAWSTSGV